MKDDDDDADDEKGISATKYPCMPSLVALQQMRNRLHLAHLGKKLMKWTAQATVRELRRLGQDILFQYEGFKEEIREAFILLARSRYFQPMLNKTVMENLPQSACIHIRTTTRSVSGVKLYVLEVVESNEDPYACLGIEKGGQIITETKKAWRELLKKMIFIAELRKGFEDVDLANKTANKRMILMQKVLIPKIRATIEYIVFGLEEMAREDTYRLKRVQEHKKRLVAKNIEEKEKAEKAARERKEIPSPVVPDMVPIPVKEASPINIYSPVPSLVRFASPIKIKVPSPPEIQPFKVTPGKAISWNKDTVLINKPEPVREPTNPFGLPAVCDQCEAMKASQNEASDMKVSVLKERLNEIIAQSKAFLAKGAKNVNVDQFLQSCESVKSLIEGYFKSNASEKGIDQNLKVKLEKLKSNLREVIGLTKTEFEQCTQTLEDMEVERDLEIHDKSSVLIHDLEEPPLVTLETKSKLVNLKNEIDDVVKMTASLQKDGFLAPSVDKFLNTCSSVKSKINEFTNTAGDSCLDKLEHLSRHVSGLEEIVTDIKVDGLTSCVIEKFLVSLKEFQSKLDEYKNRERHSTNEGLQKLFTQLDGAIELTKEAKESGLLSDSAEKFILQCERMKNKLSEPPKKTGGYIDNYEINDIMSKVIMYLNGGTLTDSTENVIQHLEQMAIDEKIASTNSRCEIIYPGCSLTCICRNKTSSNFCNPSTKSSKNENAEKSCASCHKTISSNKTDNKNMNRYFEEVEKEVNDISNSWFNSESSRVPSDSKSYTDKCNERSKSPVYKKIKQITKITRIQGADGTVSEETETITIRKEQLDSTDGSFDGNGEYVFSDDSLNNKRNKEVAVCMTPDFVQRGFLNRSRSECCFRAVSLCNTGFWPCSSADDFKFLNK